MGYVILFFGLLLLLVGAVIIVKPDSVFGLIRNHSESLYLHVLGVVVRLILGIALITFAAESTFPIALQVIGWLSMTAAIILAVIGRSNFKRLMAWALGFSSSFGRYAGVLVMLFGSFLVYAVI